MRKPRLMAATAVAAGLFLAGCGASATSTSSSASTGGAPTTVAGQPQVTIDNFTFTPAELTVPVGSTVVWTNDQAVTHTVTSDSGVFDSGRLAQGETFSYTFTQAGEFPYHCTIHTTMTGKIIVTG